MSGSGFVELGAEDLRRAAALCRDAFGPVADGDWSVRAGDLEWSARRTVDHVSDALCFYTVQLAARSAEKLPSIRDGSAEASPAQLLGAVESSAAVLAAVVSGAPPGARAFHPAGLADASGFVAMGCDEILVHSYDIGCGLGVPFSAPDELCTRVLERLFPWSPEGVDPWQALLWANGRVDLPGHGRLGADWYWQCAPLDEWDGTVKKRARPPGWK